MFFVVVSLKVKRLEWLEFVRIVLRWLSCLLR